MRAVLRNKFYWLLAGLALMVGILYVAPELLIWKYLHTAGKPYEVIQISHHGDEAYGTVSRFREIYDGHFPPGDLYMDPDAPTPFGPLQFMPLLMAGFIYLFGGSINASYLFATFLLSGIIFLLFYWLGRVITGNRIWAIFIALLGVFTPAFRALPLSFQSVRLFLDNIVKYFFPLVQTPLAKLSLGRTEDPLLTYLVFLPALTMLIVFWKKPTKKNAAWVGGLIGLMFYIYFHYWVFLVIVAGFIGLYALTQIKKDPALFRSILVMFGALAIVTIPYWVNFLYFQHSPTAQEVTLRIGVASGRTIGFFDGVPTIFEYVFYGLLGALIYFVFYRRGQQRTAVLYWICAIAMTVVWNVQIVTGYVPSPDHWVKPVSAFIFIILFHALWELCRNIRYKTVAMVLLVGCSLLVAKKIANAVVFIHPPKEFTAENTFESRTFNPGIAESWDWINANLPHEPKIISSSFITSLYLNAQTSARPYFAGGFNTAATNKTLEEHFLNTYALFHVWPDFLKQVLEVDYKNMICAGPCIDEDLHRHLNTVETVSHLYVGYYYGYPGRPKSDGIYRFVSKEKADELMAAYPKIAATWKSTGADYVYYGPWEKQISQIDLSKDRGLELVHKNQDVEIYKIRR